MLKAGQSFLRTIRPFVILKKNAYTIRMDSVFDNLKPVEIDNGKFKYVLIEVTAKMLPDPNAPKTGPRIKQLVRGTCKAVYHSDIYEQFSSCMRGNGFSVECLGGGRIEHDPKKKILKVYGYSTGYGKADHEKTREILKRQFPDYDITVSDEGY